MVPEEVSHRTTAVRIHGSFVSVRGGVLVPVLLDQSLLMRVINVNPGTRVINHMLTRLNNHAPHLRLINHFYYA